MPSPLLFLHIPKTAGTTLNTILDGNFAPAGVLDLYTDEQHQRIRDMTYNTLNEYSLVRGHIFIEDYSEILDGPIPMRVFTFCETLCSVSFPNTSFSSGGPRAICTSI